MVDRSAYILETQKKRVIMIEVGFGVSLETYNDVVLALMTVGSWWGLLANDNAGAPCFVLTPLKNGSTW